MTSKISSIIGRSIYMSASMKSKGSVEPIRTDIEYIEFPARVVVIYPTPTRAG